MRDRRNRFRQKCSVGPPSSWMFGSDSQYCSGWCEIYCFIQDKSVWDLMPVSGTFGYMNSYWPYTYTSSKMW